MVDAGYFAGPEDVRRTIMEKFTEWHGASPQEREARREEFQEFFAGMITARLEAGALYSVGDCFKNCVTARLPCMLRIGHASECSDLRLSEEAASGARHSPADCMNEMIQPVNYLARRATDTHRFFDNKYENQPHYSTGKELLRIMLKEPEAASSTGPPGTKARVQPPPGPPGADDEEEQGKRDESWKGRG